MVNVTIFGFSRFVVRPVRYAFRPDIVASVDGSSIAALRRRIS